MRKKSVVVLTTLSLLVGLPIIPAELVSAVGHAGGVITTEGTTTTAEMYIEAGEVDQIEMSEIDIDIPDGTVKARATNSSSSNGIINVGEQNTECYVRGVKVGRASMSCEYLNNNDEVLLTANVTVHVFQDPNLATSGISVLAGSSFNLIDVVNNYFDNPNDILPAIREVLLEPGEIPAFTIEGTNVSDAVVKVGKNITSDTINFYNKYSFGYDEGFEALDDNGDAFAYLDLYVFNKPVLNDINLAVYGNSVDKTVHLNLDDYCEGNLPYYSVISSNEDIVKAEGNYQDGITLTAQSTGEAEITINYEAYGNPNQTFKVLVSDIAEDGVYTELDVDPVDESSLSNDEITAFVKTANQGTILGYYDVRLVVKDEQSGATVDVIEEASSAQKVELSYPANLPELAEGYNRVYFVIRDHNGTKDILPVYDSGDGEHFYFYTDKFSTYALAYYDVEGSVSDASELVVAATATGNVGSPNTGAYADEDKMIASDQTALITTIAVLAVSILVYGVVKFAKNRK